MNQTMPIFISRFAATAALFGLTTAVMSSAACTAEVDSGAKSQPGRDATDGAAPEDASNASNGSNGSNMNDGGGATPPGDSGPAKAGYPDETNTGAKGTLTPRSGDITVNDDGTILENFDLKGAIRVYANNVTIRNVKITTGGYWPILFDGTGGVVEDSTIVGTVDSQACVGGSNMTIRRLNCSGAGDGIKLGSSSTMTDSYIHDLGTGPESHNDGCELGSVNVTVRHNTILNAQGQTAAVFIGASAPSTNILVEDNVLAGGGYTVYGPDPGSSNVRVVNNKFSTRYFAKGGSYGPVAYWKTGSGNEWSGNTWMDGASAGTTVSP